MCIESTSLSYIYILLYLSSVSEMGQIERNTYQNANNRYIYASLIIAFLCDILPCPREIVTLTQLR